MSSIPHELDTHSLDTNEEAMRTLDRLMELRNLTQDVMKRVFVTPCQLFLPLEDVPFFLVLQKIDQHASNLMYEV